MRVYSWASTDPRDVRRDRAVDPSPRWAITGRVGFVGTVVKPDSVIADGWTLGASCFACDGKVIDRAMDGSDARRIGIDDRDIEAGGGGADLIGGRVGDLAGNDDDKVGARDGCLDRAAISGGFPGRGDFADVGDADDCEIAAGQGA
jgi:hypothetical protein